MTQYIPADQLPHYVVLYRDGTIRPADPPLAFRCQADDPDHAEEQCIDCNPGAEVLWLFEGTDVNKAFQDYWGNE